jgi:hypothetical protein
VKSTITPEMSPEVFRVIKAFAEGYVAHIPTSDLYENFDDWHSLSVSVTESWDINFHMCGEPNTLYVVAHPERMGEDGFMQTDMHQWVEITNFHRELPVESGVI